MVTNAIGPSLCLALMGVGVVAASGASQNYTLPMVVGGVMGLVATLIGLSLNYEKKLYAIHPEMRKKPTGIHITDFIERRALLPALMMFFTAFSSGAGVYMIVFATDYQFSTVGIYYVINALVSVGVRFAFGSKFDGLRPRTVAVSYTHLPSVGTILADLDEGAGDGEHQQQKGPVGFGVGHLADLW